MKALVWRAASLVEHPGHANQKVHGYQSGVERPVAGINIEHPEGRWQKKVKITISRSIDKGRFRPRVYRASIKRAKDVLTAAKKVGIKMQKGRVSTSWFADNA